MKTFSILGCVWILIGCSAMPAAEQESLLEKSVICCKDVTAFQYLPLRQGTPARFFLDGKSPTYQFGNTKSYFKAFEIDTKPNQGLLVKSYFNGMLIGQYLQPVFLFLDAKFDSLGAFTPRQEFEDGNMFRDSNAHMVGGVKIPENAKYVVVHTGKFANPTDTANTRPSVNVFMAGNTPIVTKNTGKSIKLERAPTGELLIQQVDIPDRK